MNEITLEKIDIIRERTGADYYEAKEALKACDGNVVDALIYIEQNKKSKVEDIYTTKEEFLNWIKDLVKKGNVNRIKIKKDNRVIMDIPVNAGVAVTLPALIWPQLIAIGILTVVFAKITIEIIKEDGSVEIVNKVIKNTMSDVKDKVYDAKDKFTDAASNVGEKFKNKDKQEDYNKNNVYRYTVKFDDVDKDNEEKEDKE